MLLRDFNEAERSDAVSVLRPCLDVPRWVDQIADQRPFSSLQDLLDYASRAASPLTSREVESALAHHPRIGDRAAGNSSEAELSRAEQAALGDSSDTVNTALAEGNRTYEEKFGRVFLIRAAGRSKQEILEALQARISHSAAEEEPIVQQQLKEIAMHRLQGLMRQ